MSYHGINQSSIFLGYRGITPIALTIDPDGIVRPVTCYPGGAPTNGPVGTTPGQTVFFGVPMRGSQLQCGLPHGPLSIRYTVFVQTNTGKSYTFPDDPYPYWAINYTQTVETHFVTVSTPKFVTDTTGAVYLDLAEIAMPGDATLFGPPGGIPIPQYQYQTSYAIAITSSDSGAVSPLNLFDLTCVPGQASNNAGNNPTILAKIGSLCFPAFDGSDTWYANLTYTNTATNPVINYILNSNTINGGREPVYDPMVRSEYYPQPGFTLTSQSPSSRIWTNATGKTITITLTDQTNITPTWAANTYEIGQVFFSGSNSAYFSPTSTVSSYYTVGKGSVLTTTNNTTTGSALVIAQDGTATLSSLMINKSGNQTFNGILLAAGVFDQPVGNGALNNGYMPPGGPNFLVGSV